MGTVDGCGTKMEECRDASGLCALEDGTGAGHSGATASHRVVCGFDRIGGMDNGIDRVLEKKTGTRIDNVRRFEAEPVCGRSAGRRREIDADDVIDGRIGKKSMHQRGPDFARTACDEDALHKALPR